MTSSIPLYSPYYNYSITIHPPENPILLIKARKVMESQIPSPASQTRATFAIISLCCLSGLGCRGLGFWTAKKKPSDSSQAGFFAGGRKLACVFLLDVTVRGPAAGSSWQIYACTYMESLTSQTV